MQVIIDLHVYLITIVTFDGIEFITTSKLNTLQSKILCNFRLIFSNRKIYRLNLLNRKTTFYAVYQAYQTYF